MTADVAAPGATATGATATGATRQRRLPWLLLGGLVLAQICYPLAGGAVRARLTVVTVLLGYLLSVSHALLTRGPRVAAALVLVTTGGGFAVEAVGVATGAPFGRYDYPGALGPELAGVPLVIPLAWTWMAWPAWLAATRLTRGPRGDRHLRRTTVRVLIAGVGLAAWDVFLDPQMVAEGYWTWLDHTPALPGVPGIPLRNYLGWLLFAVLLAALMQPTGGPATGVSHPTDAPMHALYLWTYASSVLAHAVFLDLPATAAWGALTMATVAVPLAVALFRDRRRSRTVGPDQGPRHRAPR